MYIAFHSFHTMMNKIQKNKKEKDRRPFFDNFTEAVGFLEIVASPLSAGLILGGLLYFSAPGMLRLVLAAVIVLISLIVGIVFAARIWRKQGTIHFLSRTMATPELDEVEGEKVGD